MALDLKNLSIRSISGLVYAGLLIGVIVCGPVASAILMSLLAILATYELEVNTIEPENPDNWHYTWLLDAAILVIAILPTGLMIPFGIAIPLYGFLLIFRFILQIFISQKNPVKSISITALEQFYIGLPLFIFVFFVFTIPNRWIIVCALSMIWINDTGAYIVGSLFGRHKMFPVLSPKKSWEGFLGGLIFNIGAAFIFYYCFNLYSYELISTVYGWIYIGICVSAFATLGDLFESMLKRSLGIKDFGNIIPGHGGILDRIDSLLFVAPCMVAALYIANLILL